MKRTLRFFWIGLLLSVTAWGQQPATVTSVTFTLLNPPVSPGNITIQQTGAPRPSSNQYFYWVVARTLVGNSAPAGPVAGYNAPTSLSVSNYFTLFWQAVPGATGYDVLRTTSPSPPVGVCGCAVTTNTTNLSVNDQANSLSAYTVNTFGPSALNLTLTNEPQSAGVSHLILRQGPAGTLVADLSTGGGGGTVTTTGSPSSGQLAKFSGATSITSAAASDVVAAFTGCSGTQYLGADGACHSVTSGLTLQTNTVANSSQVLLNFQTSTVNSAGITITPSNPSGGNEKFEATIPGAITLPGPINVGASPPTAVCAGSTGCFAFSEGSVAATPTAGQDSLRADSVSHTILASINGAAEVAIAGGVGSVVGTANQITATAGPAVTLSIPSTFIAPGSIAATSHGLSPNWAFCRRQWRIGRHAYFIRFHEWVHSFDRASSREP